MTQDDRDLLIKISLDTEHMRDSVGILFKAIEGNGQPGLKQRMAVLETSHKACSETRLQEKVPKQWPNTVTAICAIVMAVIALVFGG